MAPNIQLLRSFQNHNPSLRLNSRTSSDTNIAGYVFGDQQIAIQGDEDAPYGKHPPFPDEFLELGFADPLTETHVPEDSIFALYPVEFARTFTLCVDYTPGSADNALQLIVYNVIPSNAANYVNALYFPIAFITPTNTFEPALGFTQDFAVRGIAPQVLITQEAIDTTPIRFAVSFDVSPYAVIGMTAAEEVVEEGSAGTLRLYGSSNT